MAKVSRRVGMVTLATLVVAGIGVAVAVSVPREVRRNGDAVPTAKTVVALVGSSGSFAAFTFSEAWEQSDVVCEARYLGTGDTMLVAPANGGEPMYHTDYRFAVEKARRGADRVGDEVTVRQLGGEGPGGRMVNESAAKPEVGKTYLLFLYDHGDDDVEGDYFYLFAEEAGMWRLKDGHEYVKPYDEESITPFQLTEYAEEHADDPVVRSTMPEGSSDSRARVLTGDALEAYERKLADSGLEQGVAS